MHLFIFVDLNVCAWIYTRSYIYSGIIDVVNGTKYALQILFNLIVKGLFNINSRGHNLIVVSLLVVRIISLYQYIVIIVYNINCNHGDVFFFVL